MKVFLHYEDNQDTSTHKVLKITLPKSWKNGPTSRLLTQFVESYNENETLGSLNPLDVNEMHLALKQENDVNVFVPLASDAILIEAIPDRADVYVRHGPSQTVQQMEDMQRAKLEEEKEQRASLVTCVHLGCNNRFPKGGPYPKCVYHSKPPVFHETAKFWSCCPTKKAYDWDDFQNIPGCQVGTCTDVKEEDDADEKQFLGGCDLREQLSGGSQKLRSIDDFNRAQAAGGSDAAPVLDRLKSVLMELGIEEELFNQVVEGMKKEANGGTLPTSEEEANNPKLLQGVVDEMGNKLKTALKSIAAEQLRIK